MKAVVQQIGARMDYAIPRALHARNALVNLVTDLHFNSATPLRKLARYNSGVPGDMVTRDLWRGLAYRAALTRTGLSVWPHLWMAEAMADSTVQAVRKTGADIIYGFDTAMLPAMNRLRDTGAVVVMEQCIAPRPQFFGAMSRLREKLTGLGLANDDPGLTEALSSAAVKGGLESQEWNRADRIYCASSFVSEALQDAGVEQNRIRVVPYGVTLGTLPDREPADDDRKPRIVFGGLFSWRKGALEFGQLASALKGEAQFEALGKVSLSRDVVARIAPDVTLRGHLDRAAFVREMAAADVFVLPSYSEGSATVVYEAMALGLPCVVSAESGSVITHGLDGLIVPAGDEASLIEAVSKLVADPALRREMGQRAAETAKSYTRESYGARVASLMQEDLNDLRGGVL